MELGNPDTISISFLIFTTNFEMIEDNTIDIIGHDIMIENSNKVMPFAQILLVGGKKFTNNEYEYYKELEFIMNTSRLNGYTIRAIPQQHKIWCRVSKEALNNGFSLKILGNYLINQIKKKEYVDAAEIIFVTSGKDDVMDLTDISTNVSKKISALSKMTEEKSFNCSDCDYQDVCNESNDLAKIRERLKKAGLLYGREKTIKS